MSKPPTQQALPLSTSVAELFANEGRRLLAKAREVVQAEVKQADDLAATLGITPSHLSMALHSNGRHFSLLWLPAILHVDSQHRILSHMAALVGCVVEERQPLTDEQRLKLLRAELAKSGADVDAIERRAYAEGEL